MKKYFLAAGMMSVCFLQAHVMHQEKVEKEWVEEGVAPFSELMLSWNAARPSSGKYLFYVSVKTENLSPNWSPWLLYGSWGSEGQQSFVNKLETAPVQVYQDAVEILEGQQATGFKIEILMEGDASLDELYSLHVYTNGDKPSALEQKGDYRSFVKLDVPGLSQMALSHERNRDLCSPTSTTAVTRYLGGKSHLNPVEFAQKSWDSGFDIFGNWVLNLAQASTELGRGWGCWVERLSGFDAIYEKLLQGTPVIVSVRGPLPGSALPYAKGHLLAVIGYDPAEQKVLCMDPAFPSDKETQVLYSLADFVEAWKRRGKIAYVFRRAE